MANKTTLTSRPASRAGSDEPCPRDRTAGLPPDGPIVLPAIGKPDWRGLPIYLMAMPANRLWINGQANRGEYRDDLHSHR